MKLSETFGIAINNILASKVRSLLTMLGIIIGVSAVIVIVGMGNGMENYMTDTFKDLGTDLLNVSIQGRGTSRNISEEKMYQMVEENPEYLRAVSPLVPLSTSIKIGNDTVNATSLTGVGEDYMDMKRFEIESGRGIQYIDVLRRSKVCLVGSYIAKEYYDGNAVGQSLKLGGTPYKIVGTLAEEAESEEGDADDTIYIPYTNAVKISGSGTINTYSVAMVSEDNVKESKAIVEETLYSFYKDEDAYTIISMSEILDMINQMLDVFVIILAAIAAISLLVGGIGIMNIMLVSVTERTKEIGIRKSLGAKQKHILRQFIMEAATTSALGGVLGILFGYLLSFIATKVIISMLDETLAVTPSMGSIMLSFSISVAIGILFGYLPARKAAKLNPIDALKHE